MRSTPASNGQAEPASVIQIRKFLLGSEDGEVSRAHAQIDQVNGKVEHTIDVRPHRSWFAHRDRQAGDGSRLIGSALFLLFVLAGGLLGVSYAAQFVMIVAQRHGQILASNVEALSADVALMIFSLLALGLARKGLNAIIARWGVIFMAALSAAMNYAAANGGDWRSVLTYCGPSILLAFVVDTTVSVIKKHYLGMRSEASPFMQLARVLVKVGMFVGIVALYVLRLFLSPIETPKGLRRMVLNATPLPEAPKPGVITTTPPKSDRQIPPAKERKALPPPNGKRGGYGPRANSKKRQFLALVEQVQGSLAGLDPERAYEISKEFAPQVDYDAQQATKELRSAIIAARNGGAQS